MSGKGITENVEPPRGKGGVGERRLDTTSPVTKSVHFGGECHTPSLPIGLLRLINISKAVENGQQRMEQYRLGQSVPLYDFM